MSEIPEGHNEYILFARPQGDVSAKQRQLASGILQELGFSVEIVNEDELQRIGATLQPIRVSVASGEANQEDNENFRPNFTDITDPDDYLVREHFVDYQRMNPTLRKANVTRAFSYMIFSSDMSYSTFRSHFSTEDDPLPIRPMPGIEVIKDRVQLGFPPYEIPIGETKHTKSNILKDCAIRAGSIVDAAHLLDSSSMQLGASELIVKGMSTVLEQQFV